MASYYYFRKYFSTQFILEPKILKQIDQELRTFLVDNEINLPIQYILSTDGNNYTTSNLEKVLAEPNSKNRRIAFIIVKVGEERSGGVRPKAPIYIECRFNHNRAGHGFRSCKVEIHDYRSNQNQQELADKLCELFDRTQREASLSLFKFPKWLLGGAPPSLTYFLLLVWLRRYQIVRDLKLGEMSVVDLPIYLISLIFIYFLCTLIWKAVELPKFLDRKLPITGIFSWGAEEQDFKSRISLREKLTWSIGIALIVGILGSLIATWMSSK